MWHGDLLTEVCISLMHFKILETVPMPILVVGIQHLGTVRYFLSIDLPSRSEPRSQ